jgi:hypothetical protein
MPNEARDFLSLMEEWKRAQGAALALALQRLLRTCLLLSDFFCNLFFQFFHPEADPHYIDQRR